MSPAYIGPSDIKPGYIYEVVRGLRYLCLTGLKLKIQRLVITSGAANLETVAEYLSGQNLYLRTNSRLEETIGRPIDINMLIRRAAAASQNGPWHLGLRVTDRPKNFTACHSRPLRVFKPRPEIIVSAPDPIPGGYAQYLYQIS